LLKPVADGCFQVHVVESFRADGGGPVDPSRFWMLSQLHFYLQVLGGGRVACPLLWGHHRAPASDPEPLVLRFAGRTAVSNPARLSSASLRAAAIRFYRSPGFRGIRLDDVALHACCPHQRPSAELHSRYNVASMPVCWLSPTIERSGLDKEPFQIVRQRYDGLHRYSRLRSQDSRAPL
jgi:hypothetical protein